MTWGHFQAISETQNIKSILLASDKTLFYYQINIYFIYLLSHDYAAVDLIFVRFNT